MERANTGKCLECWPPGPTGQNLGKPSKLHVGGSGRAPPARFAMKYLSLLFLGLPLLLSAAPAWAEDPSLEEMVCALNPQCAAPVAGHRMRGISVSPTVVSPAVARQPASFDITLNFPFNSAELTADSRERLDRVAKALTDPTTIKYDIIISGHTDALGGNRYNQALSE